MSTTTSQHPLRSARRLILGVSLSLLLAGCGSDDQGTPPPPGPVVISGAGADSSALAAWVNDYRALLGQDNGGDPGTRGRSGYRELSWDGVPAEFSAPNGYPADFFNAPLPPRARGIVLETPGTGLMVSAAVENASGVLPRFGNINAAYAETFKTFSAEKLFSPVGSNLVNVSFFVPGTSLPATVRGFGAVYTDVDTRHTAFEYFDREGRSLGRFETPISDHGLSFLGVAFEEAVVARVAVRYGTSSLGPGDGPGTDVAVMDNFIFGEPQGE